MDENKKEKLDAKEKEIKELEKEEKTMDTVSETFDLFKQEFKSLDELDGIQPSKEFDPSLFFIDKLTSDNFIRLGYEYYGLPKATDLMRELINKDKGE